MDRHNHSIRHKWAPINQLSSRDGYDRPLVHSLRHVQCHVVIWHACVFSSICKLWLGYQICILIVDIQPLGGECVSRALVACMDWRFRCFFGTSKALIWYIHTKKLFQVLLLKCTFDYFYFSSLYVCSIFAFFSRLDFRWLFDFVCFKRASMSCWKLDAVRQNLQGLLTSFFCLA